MLLQDTQMTTSQISNANTSYCGNNLIVGDSAEPRLIMSCLDITM